MGVSGPDPLSIPAESEPQISLAHLTLSFEFPNLHSPKRNCGFARHIAFLENLKRHSQLAKPDFPPGQSTTELSNHMWAQGKIDYILALEERHLVAALREGLRYPVLIPAESALGQNKLYLNDSPENISDLTLLQLLGLALPDDRLTIEFKIWRRREWQILRAQRLAKRLRNSLLFFQSKGEYLGTVRLRINLFSNFPGQSLLKSLDFLERLQSDPNPAINLTPGGWQGLPQVGMARRWLLISKKGAMNKARVDVAVATWIRCIRGEKIIWFQNGLTEVDLSVWKMSDDPREYDHPWAALRLREGDTL